MAITRTAAQTSPVLRIALGFVAGALSVLIFHQGMFLIVRELGLASVTPWQTTPYGPLRVPLIFNQMFWGGAWGALFGLVVPALARGPSYWVLGTLFGLLTTLFNWFVMSPIRGQAIAVGFVPQRMLVGAMIGLAFGFGLTLIFRLLSGRRS